MRSLYLFLVFFLLNSVVAQQNCFQIPITACEGTCVPVNYPNALSDPPGTTYLWTNNCGIILNPTSAFPDSACFTSSGVCTVMVAIQKPGIPPITCSATVEVAPIPLASISKDLTICEGDCTFLSVNISGPAPYTFDYTDGTNLFTVTTSTVPYFISVCPASTTTYQLVSATNGYNCAATINPSIATVTVSPNPSAIFQQNGNQLCIANYDSLTTYMWYSCGYTTLLAIDSCIEVSQNGCFCLVASNAQGCADSLCKNIVLPCDLTCEISSNSTCHGDTAILYLNTNAGSGANITWDIQVDSNQVIHITGNDTVSIFYPYLGCWAVEVNISQGNCTSMCHDTVCISNKPVAEISGNYNSCDSCVMIPILLTCTPPFTIVVSDGSNQDTISGILNSPYLHSVCPPLQTATQYSVVSLLDSFGTCAGSGIGTATVTTGIAPIAQWVQNGNQLCASPTQTGIQYSWYTCGFSNLIGVGNCVTLPGTGCYCLIASLPGTTCADTLCKDIVLPCDITCEIIGPVTVCAGTPVQFTLMTNAAPNAIINWDAELDSTHHQLFALTDTIEVVYDSIGCWNVGTQIQQANCTINCNHTICVLPAPSAEIDGSYEGCDTCHIIPVHLTGIAPWTIVVSDGSNLDTVQNILSSPYLYQVCPSFNTTTQYAVQHVWDNFGFCSTVGTGTYMVTLHQQPVASIQVNGDTLCAYPAGLFYGWYDCGIGQYISLNQCFVPTISGCYCVTVSTAFDCVDSACTQIMVATQDLNSRNELIYYDKLNEEIVVTNMSLDQHDKLLFTVINTNGQVEQLNHFNIQQEKEVRIPYTVEYPKVVFLGIYSRQTMIYRKVFCR